MLGVHKMLWKQDYLLGYSGRDGEGCQDEIKFNTGFLRMRNILSGSRRRHSLWRKQYLQRCKSLQETQHILRVVNDLVKQQLGLRMGSYKEWGQKIFQDSDHEGPCLLKNWPFCSSCLSHTDTRAPLGAGRQERQRYVPECKKSTRSA